MKNIYIFQLLIIVIVEIERAGERDEIYVCKTCHIPTDPVSIQFIRYNVSNNFHGDNNYDYWFQSVCTLDRWMETKFPIELQSVCAGLKKSLNW